MRMTRAIDLQNDGVGRLHGGLEPAPFCMADGLGAATDALTGDLQPHEPNCLLFG
jgi:hypothetical protein